MIFLEFLLFVEISKAEDFDGPIGYKDGDFDFPGIFKNISFLKLHNFDFLTNGFLFYKRN